MRSVMGVSIVSRTTENDDDMVDDNDEPIQDGPWIVGPHQRSQSTLGSVPIIGIPTKRTS
jgi:hypothetical protein